MEACIDESVIFLPCAVAWRPEEAVVVTDNTIEAELAYCSINGVGRTNVTVEW